MSLRPGCRLRLVCLAAAVSVLASCAVFQDIAGALRNLRRLSFRVNRVHDFRLAGVPLSAARSASDLSASQGLRLLDAFRTNAFPAEFVLEILAVNPNDGTEGRRAPSAP